MSAAKGKGLSTKDCTNCGEPQGKFTCGRCKTTTYCSKGCQIQHWKKGGHKQFCVAVDRRKPGSGNASQKDDELEDECAVCLSPISASSAYTLPCDHTFHARCIEEIRQFGVQHVCPLCRSHLPPTPKEPFLETAKTFLSLDKQEEDWSDVIACIKGMSDALVAKTRASANMGVRKAQYNLGILYSLGKGVNQNDTEAFVWFCKSAEQGYSAAQFIVSGCYMNGVGVEQSDPHAAFWCKKAAKQGNHYAEHNMGLMYRIGKGVEQNNAQAAFWYNKAANSGFHVSQHNLGIMYITGTGVPKDDPMAFMWLKKAAEQGDVNVQFAVGTMYGFGTGVKKNTGKERYWLQKASAQGFQAKVTSEQNLFVNVFF